MKKILWLLTFCVFSSFRHPFYLSVTDLKYNSTEKQIQGYVKIFTNDLENALKKLSGETVDLLHPRDSVKTLKILQQYLFSHLNIKVNSKPCPFELLGFENEQEAIWLYIQTVKCPFPAAIQIKNDILYDFIKEQTNILHLEVQGQIKSSKVTNPEKVIEMAF